MLRTIGVDPKIVRLVESMYSETECAIIIDGQLTDWFKVNNVGVRQSCLLSPTPFNVVLEFVMKEVKLLDNTLRLSSSFCTDICYADDTTLVPAVFEKS